MCDDWDDDAPVCIPPNPNIISNSRFEPEREENWRGDNRHFANSSRGNYRDRNRDRRFDKPYNSRRRDEDTNLNSSCEIMKVPTRFVGKIIGRGGSKISDLQFESGARIQVTKTVEDDLTIVKLFGDEEQINKAKEMITDLTTDKILSEYKPVPVVEQQRPLMDWDEMLRISEESAQAEWAKYPLIIKEFYKEHIEVTKMTEEEVKRFREENNNIVVDRTFKKEGSKPIPKPCKTFEQAFHNYPGILDEIYKAGFEKPSPIQAQAWPVLLSGEDLIGIAQTGTGKTLAFLLPALIHIDGQGIAKKDKFGPSTLIMAPTRELALQIDKEVKKYQYKDITSVCVYGGGDRNQQVKCVTDGVDIVIATPGRLNDLVLANHLNVKAVTYVVLDEADRMLDMGFEPQIRKVMYAIRPNRQTVMTSATWPIGVRRLADSYMDDPVQIYVGTLDLAATHTVTQVIEIMPDDDEAKMEAFMEFIKNMGPDHKIIVFCGKKSRASNLATELAMKGIVCQTLHGDRDQSDREQALIDIKDGTVQILIATDLASRGLDIDDVTHVLNYDFPRNIEEYVHRVGRTGRAGKYGESISYFTRGDWAQAKDLIPILEEAQQYCPEEIYKMAERYEVWKEKKDAERSSFGGRGRGRGRSRW